MSSLGGSGADALLDAKHSLGFRTNGSAGTPTIAMTIGSSGQVSQPVTTITPSASATITYTVDMDASNIQKIVAHADNADITFALSNAAAGKTVTLLVDLSNVSSFSSMTTPWNSNQVYEDQYAMAFTDAMGDDMIGAGYTQFIVQLTAYGTGDSDVYGNASVFA
jgi:hypothetical protein